MTGGAGETPDLRRPALPHTPSNTPARTAEPAGSSPRTGPGTRASSPPCPPRSRPQARSPPPAAARPERARRADTAASRRTSPRPTKPPFTESRTWWSAVDPRLRPPLQVHHQPRHLRGRRVHPREREALRPLRPRHHRVPQPDVRGLQKPRLVDPVRLERGKPRRGRDDRSTRGLGPHHPHPHPRPPHQLVRHLRRVVRRGRRPVREEVQDAPRAEHRPRRLHVERNRLPLPLQAQETTSRDPAEFVGNRASYLTA